MKKLWPFLLIFIGIIIIWCKRYQYLTTPIVSNPDSELLFSTEDAVLCQTWQPEVKKIAGVELFYRCIDTITADISLTVYSDELEEIAAAQLTSFTLKEGEEGQLDFLLPLTNVVQGERYHLQLEFKNVTDEGSLVIPSGSNYGGCSIKEQDLSEAAAFQITTVKYSKLFWLLAVLLPLFAIPFLLMTITHRKWEELAALAVFTEGIVLYLFGLIGHLAWGVYFILLLSLACFLGGVYLFYRSKDTLKDVLSPGLFIFIILFGVILISNHGDWLGWRDDLRHWGIAVRDMFYYDSFAKHADSTVILARYFPLPTLLEYYWTFWNGMISEEVFLAAYQTNLLAILIFVCRPLQKKENKKLLLFTIVSLLCPMVFYFHNVSNSLMADPLLAALLAYILVIYFTETNIIFKCCTIIPAMVTLTLTKDVGIAYAGILSMILFGDVLLRQIKEKKFSFKQYLLSIFGGILALAVFFSWQYFLTLPNKEPEAVASTEQTAPIEQTAIPREANTIEASGLSFDKVKNVITGNGEQYQQITAQNFWIELFDGQTYTFIGIAVSFVDLLGILCILYYLLSDKDKKNRVLLFIVGGAVFSLFMLMMYWFCFAQYEAMELTSFGRYFAPYLFAITILILYLTEGQKRLPRVVTFVIAVILILGMPVEGIVREGKDIEGYATKEVVYGNDEIAQILRSVGKRGEKVYYVCNGSSGYSEYVFRKTVCPVVSEHKDWSMVATEEQYREYLTLHPDDHSLTIKTADEWKADLESCEYVVLFHVDEFFIDSYAQLFEKEQDIVNGSIFQVIHSADRIQLLPIGKTGIKEYS